MTDEVVVQEQPVGTSADKPGVTVVTSDNLEAYVDEKLGKPQTTEETPNEDPEAAAAKEAEELAAKQAKEEAKAKEPKEGDTDGAKVFFKGKWVQKHDFNYRLHLKTEEAKAELKTQIDAKDAAAKAAKEEADTAIRERDALKAKYEPPPSMEIGEEPQPAQFTDIAEYSKALKDWAANGAKIEVIKEQQEKETKAAKEQAAKTWTERLTATRADLPDYAEKVGNSAVKVSDQMQEAIIESEVGPRILYHLAEHPEIAEAMGKMTVRKMLVEFGKLEASLSKQTGELQQSSTAAKISTVAKISKAPEPITPLRGANTVPGVKIDGEGKFYGTYEEFKAARLSGKLK